MVGWVVAPASAHAQEMTLATAGPVDLGGVAGLRAAASIHRHLEVVELSVS